MYTHPPGQGADYEFHYYLAGFAVISELTLKDHCFNLGILPNCLVQLVMFPTCIWQVPGLNLGWCTNYPD
jgi:hypothetical protein